MSGADDCARDQLWTIAQAALRAVDAETLTRDALSGSPDACHVLAVGKAACAMTRGALAAAGPRIISALVITKHGHGDPALHAVPGVRVLETAHPLPDASSFAAGRAAVDWLAGLPPGAALLVLISGGASALMELPAAGLSEAEVTAAHAWLLGSGLPIGAVNRTRRALSACKGGGLSAHLRGRPTRQLLLSDVAGDAPHDIGSGPFAPPPRSGRPLPGTLPPWLLRMAQRALPVSTPAAPAPLAASPIKTQIIGNSALAAQSAVRAARMLRTPARASRRMLRGDAAQAGAYIAGALRSGLTGLTVWHGETTVALPADAGVGGRNRQLALAAAQVLDGSPGLYLLALATDGGDGDATAGACVDGHTLERGRAQGLDAAAALRRCDAGTYLAATGDALHTGATGTNVRDLVLALRLPS